MKQPDETLATELFSIDLYPEVAKEIREMVMTISTVSGSFQSEILISYLKDHCIKNDWLAGNNALVTAITSRLFKADQTEKLFESHRDNVDFLESFEAYIRGEVTYSQAVSTPQMRSGDPEVLWAVQKIKLLSQFPSLREEDFRYDYGKRELMMAALQRKLHKSHEELELLLARL